MSNSRRSRRTCAEILYGALSSAQELRRRDVVDAGLLSNEEFVVAVLSVMASCLTWLVWHHRPPSATLRVTPGFTDAAARFHGQRCEANCARKVDGYAWAMLGDIRDESACRRHMGAFKEGCVTYVTDRDAQRSWRLKR